MFNIDDLNRAASLVESVIESVIIHPKQLEYIRTHHPEIIETREDGSMYISGYKLVVSASVSSTTKIRG